MSSDEDCLPCQQGLECDKEAEEEDDLYKIYSQFKELSLNVIDNNKVIELLQSIKDPYIRAQIIDKIGNTSISENHIKEEAPTKEKKNVIIEVQLDSFETRKHLSNNLASSSFCERESNNLDFLKNLNFCNTKEFITKSFTRMVNELTSKLILKNNQGRGCDTARGDHILAQLGNKQLVATNIASTSDSGLNMNHPMYKEFLDFMKSKKETDNTPPTYSTVLADEESTKVFDLNDKKEIILLLKNSDLRWKHDPWQLMARYLDSVCYTTTAYKYRMHFEMILSVAVSGEFQHFYPGNTRKFYNFLKIIIKKVLTPEEWGMSPLKERDYIHPEKKIAVKYNYWDYICSNVFTQPIPNWFCKWWTFYGPSIKILPEQYNKFSIPWIMKWNVEFHNTSEGLPCLQQTFYTKFWSKLISKDLEAKVHGHEILDLINIMSWKY
ncbi:hypothetical protein H5410_040299 [Solanum commersonii]|uniref:Uncharacterized protein n=1 Tax=Solanum commersonii TaxID=4109 RepID=A0A9J5XNI4_SOLCO|nr:hypothetical protein H5410_040299 [Solanum commersonii]